MSILVYDPTAPAIKLDERAISGLNSLNGKVVGFIDNAKPNFNLLIEDLSALLTARYGARAVLVRAKRGPSIPAPDPIIEEVATRCDLVITGSGD